MGSDASNDLSRDDLHTADASGKRYPTPMGQECFGDPAHARELLHADWTNNWNPTRLASVRPAGR